MNQEIRDPKEPLGELYVTLYLVISRNNQILCGNIAFVAF